VDINQLRFIFDASRLKNFYAIFCHSM